MWQHFMIQELSWIKKNKHKCFLCKVFIFAYSSSLHYGRTPLPYHSRVYLLLKDQKKRSNTQYIIFQSTNVFHGKLHSLLLLIRKILMRRGEEPTPAAPSPCLKTTTKVNFSLMIISIVCQAMPLCVLHSTMLSYLMSGSIKHAYTCGTVSVLVCERGGIHSLLQDWSQVQR